MRLLIVDTCYPAFLDAHYAERPEIAHAPYEVQWRSLMGRFFGTSDSYSHFLGELGHDAHEVVVNCEPLQRAWALEHGIAVSRRRSVVRDRALVLAQAEDFSPDVTYVQDLSQLTPSTLQELRARSGLLVGQIASKTPSRSRLEAFQLLVTAAPHFVEAFRREGFETEFIRLGFDPRVINQLDLDTPRSGVVFVGALGRSPTWSSNVVLERAAQRVPIDFWGYPASHQPLPGPIQERYHGEAWGLDMYRVLARCKVAINRHGDIAGDHAINMRLYEATGVGALLITDQKRDLADVLEAGVDVETYTSEDELVEKVRYYLDNETDRAKIAHAGQQRTLREHTYAHRMRELVGLLSRHLP